VQLNSLSTNSPVTVRELTQIVLQCAFADDSPISLPVIGSPEENIVPNSSILKPGLLEACGHQSLIQSWRFNWSYLPT
jgi:hypothetical protein